MWEKGLKVYVAPLNDLDTTTDTTSSHEDRQDEAPMSPHELTLVTPESHIDIEPPNCTLTLSRIDRAIDDIIEEAVIIESRTNIPTSAPIIKINSNPIKDHHKLVKTSTRRGRPTAEQTKRKDDLLKEFLEIVVTSKPKIQSIMSDKKLKKVITEEDVAVTIQNRKILIIQDELDKLDVNYVKYFDRDSLLQLKATLLTLKAAKTVCPICVNDVAINYSSAMGCDKCYLWHHLQCLKLQSASKNWTCLSCV